MSTTPAGLAHPVATPPSDRTGASASSEPPKKATRTPLTRHALQGVALFEFAKGTLVFAAGFGLLSLLHRDVRRLAIGLVTRLHLDPERHYAGLFLDAAAKVTDAHLWALAGLALLYSLVRWIEAYGLWKNRRWAAWLGAASGAIYVPVEVLELVQRPGWTKGATLLLNVSLVAYLLWTLKRGAPVDKPLTRAPA